MKASELQLGRPLHYLKSKSKREELVQWCLCGQGHLHSSTSCYWGALGPVCTSLASPPPLSLLAGPPQRKAHSWLRVFPIWSASTHTPRYLRGLCLTSFRPFLLKGALLNDAFFGFPSEMSTQWRLLSPFPYPIFLYSNHHHLAYSTLLLFVLIIICVAR